MHSHVVKTRTIVTKIPFTKELQNVAEIAADHHEMLNGTGYPNGVKADEIPFQARILAVADVFDALTAADRPYKKACSLELTFKILREEVDKGRMDGRIVDLLIDKKLYEGHKEDQAEYPWKLEIF
jgi:HD-GYP domain-containing protein (c-di-GMP phosphodiesterase class II)